MSLTFVNHNGDPISQTRMAAMRAQGTEQERQRRLAVKADPVSVHKGWRVSGIQPGKLEEAKQAHERLCQMAQKAGGKPPEPFDETAWLRTAKRTAVRSKPYILQEAAQQCKELAGKAGWLEVQRQEIKKVVAWATPPLIYANCTHRHAPKHQGDGGAIFKTVTFSIIPEN